MSNVIDFACVQNKKRSKLFTDVGGKHHSENIENLYAILKLNSEIKDLNLFYDLIEMIFDVYSKWFSKHGDSEWTAFFKTKLSINFNKDENLLNRFEMSFYNNILSDLFPQVYGVYDERIRFLKIHTEIVDKVHDDVHDKEKFAEAFESFFRTVFSGECNRFSEQLMLAMILMLNIKKLKEFDIVNFESTDKRFSVECYNRSTKVLVKAYIDVEAILTTIAVWPDANTFKSNH